MNLHAAPTLALAILVALSAVGSTHGATAKKNPAVPTKVMVAGLKAIHYPVARPKKLT